MIGEADQRWRAAALLAIVLPGVFAACLHLYATATFGPGLAPDTQYYLQGARHLVAGQGYSFESPDGKIVALTKYPPLYSLLLCTAKLFGHDPLWMARPLGALELALAVMCGTGIVWWITRTISVTWAAGIALALATDQMENAVQALSEPTFILAVLGLIVCLSRFFSRGFWAWCVGAAVCASAAAMTRYIGMLFLPLGAILVIVMLRRPWWQRISFGVLFLVIASTANALLILHNHHADSAIGRTLETHPANLSHVVSMFNAMSYWFVPGAIPGSTASLTDFRWYTPIPIFVLVIGVTMLAIETARRTVFEMWVRLGDRPGGYILAMCVVIMPVYLLAIFLSISFVDAATPLDTRVLAPLFIPAFIVTFCGGWFFYKRSPAFAVTLGSLFAIVLAWEICRTAYWTKQQHGIGDRLVYANATYSKSPTLAALRKLPREVVVYTNLSDLTYLQAGRIDDLIPAHYQADGKTRLPTWDTRLDRMRKDLWTRGGAVVYFDKGTRRPSPTRRDLDYDFARGWLKYDFTTKDPNGRPSGDGVIYATPGMEKYLGPIKSGAMSPQPKPDDTDAAQ